MRDEFSHHTFENGLTLVAERMRGVRSAAFTMFVPAGAAWDPVGQEGSAAVLTDMIFRGAGQRDSRQVTTDLDNLGLQRGEGVESVHVTLAGATLASNLLPALSIYRDVLREPHLPEDELDAARSLALQELQALEDEPRQKILVELRVRHVPFPLGRPTVGTRQGLEALTHAGLLQHWQQAFRPDGAILGIAGDIEWTRLRDGVEQIFGDWEAQGPRKIELGPRGPRVHHITQTTAQTQIGIAWNTVPYSNPEYFQAQGAVTVLSGGTANRLFTEVRERRGLCYAVYASYLSLREFGLVVCYAGTSTDRAQETLDVTLQEITRLPAGIAADEVDRARAGLKASLIMQGESSASRSAAIAGDWYHLRRVRSFAEMHGAIDGLTPQSIVEHLDRHPPRDFTVVTLGERALVAPSV